MNTLQFLYASNIVSRTPEGERQTLSFAVSVENLAFEKRVEIHWAGNDGQWQVLPCHFVRSTGANREVWEAEVQRSANEAAPLPGGVTFAAHARIAGRDFWDSDNSRNYTLASDAGLWLAPEWPVLSLRVRPRLAEDYLPITVAAHATLHPRRVFLRWSSDRWQTCHETECFFWRRHWERTHASNARNPSEAGSSLWVAHLPAQDAYRIDYAVGCEGPTGTVWDNDLGSNYQLRRERLKVLTLNLHCLQEEDQDAKLSTIARAIDDLNVDVVCLQEVAEPWAGGNAAAQENSARLIRDRLRQTYQLVSDWSHRGFGVYREGCAILTRHEVRQKDSGYVSPGRDENSIHSRRVVMVQVAVPYFGTLNLFSVHLSWWQDGFREQFERLNTWAREKHASGVNATLLLGDFNAKAGSAGYALVTGPGDFEDQYLKVHRGDAGGGVTADDARIDYIFLRRGNPLEVKEARVLFTASDYGRVSDHPGYYAEFEPSA